MAGGFGMEEGRTDPGEVVVVLGLEEFAEGQQSAHGVSNQTDGAFRAKIPGAGEVGAHDAVDAIQVGNEAAFAGRPAMAGQIGGDAVEAAAEKGLEDFLIAGGVVAVTVEKDDRAPGGKGGEEGVLLEFADLCIFGPGHGFRR